MARRAKPASPKLLRANAYERLLAAILAGDLAPGAHVDERRLARDFALGHASVRDALLRLSLEGLVERQPRVGTRVCELKLRDLQDVFEARALLETYAAALASQRALPAEIQAIRDGYLGHDEAAERRDLKALIAIDQAFHRGLAAASRNAEIERMLTRLHNQACRFWVFGLERASPEEMKAQGRAHLDILDAVEARDLGEIERRVRKAIGYSPDNRFTVYEPRLFLTLQAPRPSAP